MIDSDVSFAGKTALSAAVRTSELKASTCLLRREEARTEFFSTPIGGFSFKDVQCVAKGLES